jgi:hypothetical protein
MNDKFLKKQVEFYLDILLSFGCDADPLFKNNKVTKNVITEETFWNCLARRILDPADVLLQLVKG